MSIAIEELAQHFAKSAFHIISIEQYYKPPGMSFNALTEAYPGFVFPLEGKAEFTFNGTSYFLKPDNIVHGGARMQLDRRVIGNEPWAYLLILYEVHAEPTNFISLSQTHFELPIMVTQKITSLLQQLRQNIVQTDGITLFKNETLFRILLQEIFQQSRAEYQLNTRQNFTMIKHYIDTHFSSNLTIASLSEQFQLSEHQLFYLFQKYTGIGPWDYVITYRLNHAKTLLLQTNTPIYIIGEMVGYQDPYYFSRIFKKHFQLSPTLFRKKFRNSPSFTLD